MIKWIKEQFSRKLLLVLLVWVAGSVLAVLKLLPCTFVEWSNFSQWLVGIYVGGNIADSVSTNIGGTKPFLDGETK